MYLAKQYMLYDLAIYLLKQEQYKLFHFDYDKNEIWVAKSTWRQTNIIRLIHKDFDWKNHLKQDIAYLFQRVRNLRRHFRSKHIQVFNVYISELEPVDDWEKLKTPMLLDERNPVKMKVFYLSQENWQREQRRLCEAIGTTNDYTFALPSIDEQERTVNYYKYEIQQYIYEKNKRVRDVFSFGKPQITYFLLYVNIIMFFILEFNGGSTDIETLLDYGAKYNPAIIMGEWWRIITSMFLHIGFLHLLMNMIALYYLGTAVERIYGSKRFIFIYFLAGIFGGITSFAFNFQIAAGASGALFGLFGALLFFGTVYKDLFKQTMGKNLIFILLINIVFGFMVPQIDMGAHLGGLIGGFIASAIVYLPKRKQRCVQFSALASYLIIISLLTFYGYAVNVDYLEQLLQ